jgi:hypothetical protein
VRISLGVQIKDSHSSRDNKILLLIPALIFLPFPLLYLGSVWHEPARANAHRVHDIEHCARCLRGRMSQSEHDAALDDTVVLIRVAADMRDAQRTFFVTRDGESQFKAKTLEMEFEQRTALLIPRLQKLGLWA